MITMIAMANTEIAYYVSGNTQSTVHTDITNSHDSQKKEALL